MPIDLDGETRVTTDASEQPEAEGPVPLLTILAHPDPARVGERLPLRALKLGREVLISRIEPMFFGAREVPATGQPLGGRYLSRQPIRLRPGNEPGEIVVDLSTTRTRVEVDGDKVDHKRALPSRSIDAGVVLKFGGKVVLLLHRSRLPVTHDPELAHSDLIGNGAAMGRLRQQIQRLAPLDVSVLLRGESGTGKELVARALHQQSLRSDGPFVAVNMAVLGPSLAAAALFGAERGAYTGADRKRIGHFQRAQGGTLFLDEIGEAPAEVQTMLLRVLETREVQPVGSTQTSKVDVRVVAATDARLEEAMAADRFKVPLFHRLAGYTVFLPALRDRREDLGHLLYVFLQEELRELGQPPLEASDPQRPWPPAALVARLALHAWPGNVRELRNVARRLAISDRDEPVDFDQLLGPLASSDSTFVVAGSPFPPSKGEIAASAAGTAKRRTLRKLEDVGEDELLEALRSNRWHVQATSDALGISRPNLYRLMEASPSVRTAKELGPEEIEIAIDTADGDLEAAAFELKVSTLGLKRRMKVLGLPLA